MIDKELAEKATREDHILLNAVHPVGSTLLRLVAERWKLKRIPAVGVIISEAAMIREIFMDKNHFSKDGKGASTSFWNPIIGGYGLLNMEGEDHLKLKRVVSPLFAAGTSSQLVQTVFTPHLEAARTALLEGEELDIVSLSETLAYLSLWHLSGLSLEKLEDIDFNAAVKALRSVTEGVNPVRKKLSKNQVESAKAKLAFLDALTIEAYNDDTKPSIPNNLKKEGYDEEVAISFIKSLFVTGTETIIGFMPRMTALFIKTGYLDHLSTNPEHVIAGVEEALRVTVPTPVAARIVKEDYEFHGTKLKKGERVVLSTIEASKRYGDFNPFKEIDRNIKGLWFGAGIHMCVGLPLAQQQAQAMALWLAEINKTNPLELVNQLSNDKGHTGSYKELTIKCKTF